LRGSWSLRWWTGLLLHVRVDEMYGKKLRQKPGCKDRCIFFICAPKMMARPY
jgi:hypothetical protein